MLRVNLTNHYYDILLERQALQQTGAWAASLWQPQRVAIITDSNVVDLYGAVV